MEGPDGADAGSIVEGPDGADEGELEGAEGADEGEADGVVAGVLEGADAGADDFGAGGAGIALLCFGASGSTSGPF